MVLLLKFLSKVLQNRRFSALASRSIPFWSCKIAEICGADARNSFAFCNSVFGDRSGMAASTFLAAAAASVIQLCFASVSRESHCHGCMKVANGALAAFFSFWH